MSAFDNGDGFIVRHVDSGEILEVSIFYDELDSSDDEEAEDNESTSVVEVGEGEMIQESLDGINWI